MKKSNLDKTFNNLEWREFLKIWKSFCQIESNEENIDRIDFASDRQKAEFRSQLISDLKQLKNQNTTISLSDFSELEDQLERLEHGGTIRADSLHEITIQLRIVKDIQKKTAGEKISSLSKFIEPMDSLDYLESLLADTIDEHGEIRNDASSELYGLRSRKQILQKKLTAQLDNILEQKEIEPFIQDKFHTLRQGRFVIPVKSEFRSEVPGVIHGVSNTGASVFVEPASVIKLNNRISEIESEIEVEEYRILSQLGESVLDDIDQIRINEEKLLVFDLWNAAFKMAVAYDFNPISFSSDNKIKLLKCVHPFLLKSSDEVVRNDILVDNGKVMIITGPNAGGKTVTVKTTGVIVLMSQMGLHVPASPDSVIPFFDNLYTMIGDEQNISSHLSTFSAQIVRINTIIRKCTPRDLVLFDELAAGTDPAQGSSLAQSILEFLADKQVTTLVTTHFSRLKALATLDNRFTNASFSSDSLKPTYKLITGLPGTSDGIKVAGNLGLDRRIILRAQKLMGSDENKIDSILEELLQKRKSISDKEEELKHLLRENKENKREIDKLVRQKKRELNKIKKTSYQDIDQEVVRLKRLLRKLEKKIKSNSESKTKLKEYRKSLDKINQKVENSLQPFRGEIPDFAEIKIDDIYWSHSLKKKVRVLGKSNNKVEVQLGNFSTQISPDDLEKLSFEEKPEKLAFAKVNTTPSQKKDVAVSEEKLEEEFENSAVTGSNTLDLRGMRREEALEKVETYIDKLMLDNEKFCTIIHGYGTGVLKKAVRRLMKKSPFVVDYRPGKKGEGADGVTVVRIVS
ncbi:MAG: endonuclease MutS2 [Myxococcota bacterium]